MLPQKVQNEICSQIPLGRIGEPSEVASVIAFLASEQASYVSGSCVDVLGGYIKRRRIKEKEAKTGGRAMEKRAKDVFVRWKTC